ncbi:protein C1orf194 homolog [Teleopsis dalmanni]|uniref:protein C1orf194 homolog n=1 Tax=Teleopsis dalmanni TaxID=139649 RepID=UPI0018CF4987|nr:protein C1orf194 homolog [Teleopsis dalmanni]
MHTMMRKYTRFRGLVPEMDEEGTFIKPMPLPIYTSDIAKIKPNHRLFYHQTLASVRRHYCFKQTDWIPRDKLDFEMQSRYNHVREVFPDKVDMVMQKETCSTHGDKVGYTYRKMRNTCRRFFMAPSPLQHPLRIGGILYERKDPNSVKLMVEGHHSQLTNAGFSRQDSDGTIYSY